MIQLLIFVRQLTQLSDVLRLAISSQSGTLDSRHDVESSVLAMGDELWKMANGLPGGGTVWWATV